MRTTLLALATACCIAPAGAQILAGEISPNPAPVGSTITFTYTNRTANFYSFGDPNCFAEIRFGSPTGPRVDYRFICSFILSQLGPNQTGTFTWNQADVTGTQVPAGTYFIAGQLNGQSRDWFPFQIGVNNEPSLSYTGAPATVGGSLNLTLKTPADPGSIYFTFWSFSSNNPVAIPGVPGVVLDAPIFADYFTGGIGVTDAMGNANGGPIVNIPNVPSLLYKGAILQAGVLTPGGQTKTTNGLPLSIR